MQHAGERADLVAHGEAAFVGTRLGFVPALRTISTGFDLAALWKGLSEGEKPEPAPLDAPQIYAVWRRGFEVFHAPLSDAEARGLELARGGATLGEVCEAFAGAEDPARAAFEAIASWFNEGWVAQILPPDA